MAPLFFGSYIDPYNSSTSNRKLRPSAAVIASAVVGAVLLVIFLSLCLFLIHRRRRRGPKSYPLPGTPSLPIQGPSMMEAFIFTDTLVPAPRQSPEAFFAKPTIGSNMRESVVPDPGAWSPSMYHPTVSGFVSSPDLVASNRPMFSPSGNTRAGQPLATISTESSNLIFDNSMPSLVGVVGPEFRTNILMASKTRTKTPRRPFRRPPTLQLDG
jgi:hypothetical protein